VLDTAGLGVIVYEEMPYEGADIRSIVLTPVAGHTTKPSLGMRISSTIKGVEENCTLQVSCFFDDPAKCRALVDKVAQVLFDHADELEILYDIHGLKRSLGPIPGPVDANIRGSHMLMDFQFYTHRVVT
jgi:hypothetical protein